MCLLRPGKEELPSASLPTRSTPREHTRTSCPQVAYFNSALAGAEEERARLRQQLKEQKLRCRRLARLAAPGPPAPKEKAPAPGSGDGSVPRETHQALQVAMDKLQVSQSPRARPGGRGSGRRPSPDPAALAAEPLHGGHAGESGSAGAGGGAGTSLRPAFWRDGHYW